MLRVRDVAIDSLVALLGKYDLMLVVEAAEQAITGSFWGDSEAGIVGNQVYVRNDTPVHSLLHEACHTICMDEARRSGLKRDAGGDDLEETAVCYLQILLANEIDGVGQDRLMQDMDNWGYSFRLGSTAAWFAGDAEDAAAWLQRHSLINLHLSPTFALRGSV